MSSSSTKPYLLRALYEWSVDNDLTPHIVAWVNEQTRVPMQYVKDKEIVLNIGPSACQNLVIDNEWVHFGARFSGVAHEVWIPVGHIVSMYARETGDGMAFDEEEWTEAEAAELADEAEPDAAVEPQAPAPAASGKHLKLIK